MIPELINSATTIAGKFVKDKNREMEIGHEERMGQIEVNKVEAQSTNLFVAGWRPFIGWMGGVSLGYNSVIAPIFKLPIYDPETFLTLMLGLLGIGGGFRTLEKLGGVATPYIQPPPTPPPSPPPKKRSRWF